MQFKLCLNSLFYILIAIILLTSKLFSNKLKQKPKENADETQIPYIHLHLEEEDKNEDDLRKFEKERYLENLRVKENSQKSMLDSKLFQQIIANQNNNLSTLSALDEASNDLLYKITVPNSSN